MKFGDVQQVQFAPESPLPNLEWVTAPKAGGGLDPKKDANAQAAPGSATKPDKGKGRNWRGGKGRKGGKGNKGKGGKGKGGPGKGGAAGSGARVAATG